MGSPPPVTAADCSGQTLPPRGDAGAAISGFLTSLTQSVISSGQALASGSAELQFENPKASPQPWMWSSPALPIVSLKIVTQ